MGTRADFYIGRGANAEWLGSVAWDGYPEGFEKVFFQQKRPGAWRRAVQIMLAGREDATTPDKGWPWPWEDSRTTDYAYAYEKGRIWASAFGRKWFNPLRKEPDTGEGEKVAVFPDMKSRQKVTLGKRSGVTIISVPSGAISEDQTK